MYRQVTGCARDRPYPPGERHSTKCFEFISIGSREPYLISVPRPGQSFFAVPLARQRLLLALAVDDRDPPAVVVLDLVIHEGHQVAFWRDARVTDVTARFVKHLAYWVFQPVASFRPAHHGELGAVGGPVCLLYVFEDFPRRATGDRYPRQTAAADASAEIMRMKLDGHLAHRRHSEHVCVR